MEDILRDSFGLVKCPDKNWFQATFFISHHVAKMPLALMPEPKVQHLAWMMLKMAVTLPPHPFPAPTSTIDVHTSSCNVTPSLIDLNKHKTFAPD